MAAELTKAIESSSALQKSLGQSESARGEAENLLVNATAELSGQERRVAELSTTVNMLERSLEEKRREIDSRTQELRTCNVGQLHSSFHAYLLSLECADQTRD